MGLLKDEDIAAVKQLLAEMSGAVALTHYHTQEDCPGCPVVTELMSQVEPLSEQLTVTQVNVDDGDGSLPDWASPELPAVQVLEDLGRLRWMYHGVPAGYEFGQLLQVVLLASGADHGVPPAMAEELGRINKPIPTKIFLTPACPHCPRAVDAVTRIAMVQPLVQVEVFEASEFPEISQKYQVSAVPLTIIGETEGILGAVPGGQFVEAILKQASLAV
ncbi:MAG: hypothetical protein B1H03_01395 [Planctomycetales bacterium 4484_113]|nr:MAG: hypothetical protein B1H03_01395 [Planctomycetales bacterium 4484_113]